MNICFVTPRFPYPAIKGDQVRTYHQIRALSRRHAITLVAACFEQPQASAVAEMHRWCERIEIVPLRPTQALGNLARGLWDASPFQVLLYASPAFEARLAAVLASKPQDVVHASLIRTAPYVWNLGTPTVVDLVDALSHSIAGRAAHVAWPLRAAYACEQRRVERYERAVCAHFARSVVCAPADAKALGSPNLEVVRNAVDGERFAFTPDGRDENLVVMTGNMGYQPNVDAAVWFATSIWARVRQAVPEARLQFVGARPAAAVRQLGRLQGVEVTGPVADMHAYLRRATLAICPMRCGSGIQNKVLEAMASGAPMIATPLGNAGTAAQAGLEITIAEDAMRFGGAVIALLAEPARRRELAVRARALVDREFTWEAHARRLETLYQDAVTNGARPDCPA